jgi:hypothetical protein
MSDSMMTAARLCFTNPTDRDAPHAVVQQHQLAAENSWWKLYCGDVTESTIRAAVRLRGFL